MGTKLIMRAATARSIRDCISVSIGVDGSCRILSHGAFMEWANGDLLLLTLFCSRCCFRSSLINHP